MVRAYKGKKVFVTGHTGFKGSWLTAMLSSLGADVYGYSLAPDTQPSHFNILKTDQHSTIGDIIDFRKLQESVNDASPEILFHLAAQPLVRESYSDPFTTYNTNVIGTLNVLRAVAASSTIKAVVIVTTDKVYENKEWDYPYREVDQLGGYDMYSSSKACCEILVSSFRNSFLNPNDFGKKHKVLVASARAGNVIGGGDWSKDRLIPDLVKAAATNQKVVIRSPNAVRPWQHVMDCLYGYLLLGEKLLQQEKSYAEAWNFAPYFHESKTVREVIDIAKDVWKDIEPSYEPSVHNVHEASMLKLDNSKAVARLKWNPVFNTEEAIIHTIEWYKQFYLNGEIRTLENINAYLKSFNDRLITA